MNLKECWISFAQNVLPRINADAVYEELVKRYSEPARAYHTLRHIEECRNEFAYNWQLSRDHDAVEMALWFHDIVYDTKAKDNEEKSAEFALQVIHRALLPEDFGEAVTKLILATKHLSPPEDHDAQLLVDIDLSILGQSELRFDEYEKQIRKEYEWVPQEIYAINRSAILRMFLERPRIYSTPIFYAKYERNARKNIERSLSKLNRP